MIAIYGVETVAMTEINPSSAETQAKLAHILERMSAKATETKVKGVSVVGLLDKNGSLVIRTQNCGPMCARNVNFLAVAFTKLSECCDTLKDSGSNVRPPYNGELGYTGAAIKPVGAFHYIAAFSGGTGEEDLAISKYGLEIA